MNRRLGLINMPFASTKTPSIQLGLLQALAKGAGWSADSLYLNLPLATALGINLYEALCQHRGHQFGDWLFAHEAFLDDDPDPDNKFVETFSSQLSRTFRPYGMDTNSLLALRRNTIPAYLDGLLRQIDWSQYDVLGFTSTFQQTAASIALSRRIKHLYPELTIIFGGANCDDEMGLELLRICDAIDYVFIGEADVSLPDFLGCLAEDQAPLSIPYVVGREHLGEIPNLIPASQRLPLDELPMPDYADFFLQLAKYDVELAGDQSDIELPFEAGRGCWWGQKHHCTFCGLNGQSMTFRSKSPDRVLMELATLANRHGSFRFSAVDNIMDHQYFKDLLPKLSELELDYDIFFEIKANLSRENISIMRKAGVRRVQPGIESLSTSVLRGMRKGIDMLHNVNFLRWARYYNIQVSWNILYGFPHDRVEDYEAQGALVPLLHHLEPPTTMNKVWMERFSPLYSARDGSLFEFVEPELSYRYIFPTYVDLDRLAYFFDYRLTSTCPVTVYECLGTAVDRWKAGWSAGPRPELRIRRSTNFIQIDDTRRRSERRIHRYDGLEARLYTSCLDRPISAEQIATTVGESLEPSAIKRELLKFVEAGLLIEENNKYLSLAIPLSTH